jgi:hypothetical protein
VLKTLLSVLNIDKLHKDGTMESENEITMCAGCKCTILLTQHFSLKVCMRLKCVTYFCIKINNGHYLSLIIAGTGQASKEQTEKCRQNFSQSAGRVGHNNLPHMKSCLSHHKGHI